MSQSAKSGLAKVQRKDDFFKFGCATAMGASDLCSDYTSHDNSPTSPAHKTAQTEISHVSALRAFLALNNL